MASSREVEELLGNIHEDIRCRVRIKGVDDGALRVAALDAREVLSQPFCYTLTLATNLDTVAALEKSLGQEAAIALEREGNAERTVYGIVSEVVPDGRYVGKEQARTTVVIEPRLANLRYSGGFRIFQNKTVQEIVQALVEPEHIDVAFRLRPVPPAREYRTQMDESDLDFIARLLADEGIHYFFELTADKTTVVFTNNPLGFTEIEGKSAFPFREVEDAVTGEHVRSIRRAQRVRTGAIEHRDYDFTKPRTALVGRSETADPQSEANTKRREWRDYPGGFTDPDAEGTPRAKMRLEELRSDSAVLDGEMSTLRLVAGKLFSVTGHRDGAFNKKLLCTRVGFTVSVEGTFWGVTGGARGERADATLASFEAVVSDVPLRPRRLAKPKSRLQSARVVGPKEGDPHVDEYGRVTVQFMWDRDGTFDEHSSCSIRMMTPAAHDDEGFWSAHKVGSEVIVDFLDDDIDRPIILGAIYNGKERQPYKQPDAVTKSSWKVRSIPGGKGYNELTFENKSGGEQILLHAQRDHVEHVLRNHSETIGANQSSAVGADQSVAVGANQSIAVKGNRTVKVHEKEDVTIVKEREHTVKGASDTLTVTDGDRTINVDKGNHTRNVKLLDKTEAENFDVHARDTAHVVGDKVVLLEQKGASYGMHDEQAFVHSPKLVQLDCPSGFILLKDNKVQINATDELVLVCGQSSISLKKDGTITIQGGKEVKAMVGNSSLQLEPAKGALSGASVEVNAVGQCKVAGAIVKIN